MKAITFLAAILIGTTSLVAQDVPENEVPSEVLNTFKKEFPKASDVEWEREGELYNVDFEIGFFTDYEAWFDASGNLIKSLEEISESDLPAAVKESVNKQYNGYNIDEVEKLKENNMETYLVEIEKGNDEQHVVFTKEGKIIKNK